MSAKTLVERLRAPRQRPGYPDPLPPHPWMVEAADEIERLRAALQRAFKELDDILEDWQLDGRHGQARYEQLKRETDAILAVLKGE